MLRNVAIAVGVLAVLAVAAVLMTSNGDEGGRGAPRDAALASRRGTAEPGAESARPAAELSTPEGESAGRDPERERAAVGASADPLGVVDAVSLVGRIVADGLPVAGARVFVAPSGPRADHALDSLRGDRPERRDTRSGDDGRFRFDGVRPGGLRLAVRASGLAPHDDDWISVPAERQVDLGDVVLAAGIVVAGVVVDADGLPVGGVEVFERSDVWAQGQDVAQALRPLARSDAEGRFATAAMTPGPWSLLFRAAEHPDHLHAGLQADSGVRDEIVVRLPRGFAVTGRVTDDERPDGLAVRASSASGERDVPVASDGSFRIAGIAEELNVELRAFLPEERRGVRWLSDGVSAKAGDADVELSLVAPSSLRIAVREAGEGRPLTMARFLVSARDGSWKRRLVGPHDGVEQVDPGVYRLHGISAAATEGLDVEVTAVGHRARVVERIVPVPDGERDLGEVSLELLPTIVARVAAPDGAAVAGARVHAVEQLEPGGREPSRPRGAPTDADGVARIAGVEGRGVWIWATSDEHAPSETRLVSPAADETLELVLRRGASVRCSVRDAQGRAVGGVLVLRQEALATEQRRPWSQSGGDIARVTDAEGVALFERLPPGAHGFCVHVVAGGRRRASEWSDIQLAAGDERSLELTPPPVVAVFGRVTTAGKPLAGATVFAQEGEARSGRERLRGAARARGPSARTAGDGRYRLEGLTSGAWVLVTSHGTRAMDAEVRLRFDEPGEYEFDIALGGASLTGVVRDPQGRAVAGARVRAVHAEDVQAWARRARELGSSNLAITDVAGAFALEGCAADQAIAVLAWSDGYSVVESDPFVVPSGEGRELELVLQPAGSIEVTLLDGAGAPVVDWMITAGFAGQHRKERGVASARTDGDGLARLVDLAAGPWSVRVTPPNRELAAPAEPQRVEVEPGGAARLTIRIQR